MPTIKQKKAFEKTLENGGNITEAMRQAEYAETTINNPKNLTESDGWKILVEEHLPDELLLKVHKQGLKATTKKPHLVDRDDKGRPVYEYVSEDDYAVRHRYLDTAYKVKGKMVDKSVNVNLDLTDELRQR